MLDIRISSRFRQMLLSEMLLYTHNGKAHRERIVITKIRRTDTDNASHDTYKASIFDHLNS